MQSIEELAEVFKVLGNPVRLKILVLCAKREHTSRELRERLRISKPLLIAHLKKLQKVGLIESKIIVDKESAILRKRYRTSEFEIKIDKNLLRNMNV